MTWKPSVGKWNHWWFAELTAQLWDRYVLPRFTGAIRYIETGVCEGMSLTWMLEHYPHPDTLLVGIDPFWNSRHWHPTEGQEHRDATVANLSEWFGRQPESIDAYYRWQSERKPTCEVIALSSVDALKTEKREFDLAYVDGSHNADVAILDIILMFRLLRDGGLIVIDDVDREVSQGRPEVLPAVKAFEATYRGYFDPVYVHQKQIAYMKRPRRRRGYPPVLECGPVITPG